MEDTTDKIIGLPITIRKGRLVYSRVRIGEKGYIFSKSKLRSVSRWIVDEKNKPKKVVEFELDHLGYIVLEIKIKKQRQQFPHDAAFGSWAWAKTTMKAALEKFNKIEAEGNPSHVIHPKNDYRTYEAIFHSQTSNDMDQPDQSK